MGLRLLVPLTLIVILFTTPLLASCQSREFGPDEILERTREAIEDIDSYREIKYYSETSALQDLRSIRIKECEGFNTAEHTYVKDAQTKDIYAPYIESVTYGGSLYSRGPLNDPTWKEESRKTPYMFPSERLLSVLDIFLMDTEIAGMTIEQLDGDDVYHLHFTHLESDFFVTDGEISSQDLWIDKDTFYPVRLDTLLTFSSGYGREVKNISKINEPIEIVPPI